jgi:5-methylcytosine-specific restriction endonuclease McrA
MKIKTSIFIEQIIDVPVNRYIKLPKWALKYNSCAYCGTDFDSEEYLYDDAIIMESPEENLYYICQRCWDKEKPET